VTKVLRDPDGSFERLLAEYERRIEALERRSVGGGMTVIEEKVLAADGPIDFTGIPSNFRALKLIASTKLDAAGDASNLWGWLNNDQAANYWYSLLQGSGGVASAGSGGGVTNGMLLGYQVNQTGASDLGATEATIFQYSAPKNTVSLGGGSAIAGAANIIRQSTGLWNNTAVVNRLQLKGDAATTFKAGSWAILLGIGRL
jgi:hypothetical protein